MLDIADAESAITLLVEEIKKLDDTALNSFTAL
jgi:hypothetical protein